MREGGFRPTYMYDSKTLNNINGGAFSGTRKPSDWNVTFNFAPNFTLISA